MRKILSLMLLLSPLAVAGCGGPSGPAKPEDTKPLSQQEIEQRMTQNVPPDAKKMMDSYKKGGGGGQRPR
jgi:hypothetical protein